MASYASTPGLVEDCVAIPAAATLTASTASTGNAIWLRKLTIFTIDGTPF